MAAPIPVWTGTTVQALGTSLAFPVLPTVQDGDYVLYTATALIGSTVTLTGLTGGAAIVAGPPANGSNAHQVWLVGKALTAADSGGLAVTGTLSASAQAKVTAVVYRGAPSAPLSAFALNQGTANTTVPLPTVTPTIDDSLLITVASLQFANSAGSQQTDVPAGWTELVDSFITTGTSRIGHLVWTKQLIGQAGVAQTPPTVTNSINHRTVSATVVVAPTDTAPPEPTPVNPTAAGLALDSLGYQGGSGPANIEAALEAPDIGFTDARVDAIIGRMLYRDVDASGGTGAVIDGWAAAGFNPYVIVPPSGTNPVLNAPQSEWPTQLANLRAKIAAKLPGTHLVYFTTVVADPVDGLDMNRVIGSQGNRPSDWNTWIASQLGPNERLIDWYAYARAHPGLSDPTNANLYWQNDANEVHMNPGGYALRNGWMAQQIDLTPITTVTLTRSTTWATRAPATLSRTTSWSTRAATTPATRATSWATRARVAPAARSTTWPTRARTTLTRPTLWNVTGPITPVAVTRSTSWAVRSRVTTSRSTSWATRARATLRRATAWSVRQRVTDAVTTTWATRSRLTTTTSTSWAARGRVTLTRATVWNVDPQPGIVTLQRTTIWHTRARVTTTRSATWPTRTPVALGRATSWNVRRPVTVTRSETWSSRRLVTTSRSTTWTVAAVATPPGRDITVTARLHPRPWAATTRPRTWTARTTMTVCTYPTGSVDYVAADVTADVELDTQKVEISLTTNDVRDWQPAQWEGEVGTTRTARTVEAVTFDAPPFTAYTVHVRVTDVVEIPIVAAEGRIHVVH